MKKKISMFLAVVMIITLLPAMGVFAATTNSVSAYPQISEDYNFSDYTTGAPILAIKGGDGVSASPGNIVFRLTLENSEWDLATAASKGWVTAAGTNRYRLANGFRQEAGPPVVQDDVLITWLSDTMVEINVDAFATSIFKKDSLFEIPMLAKATDTGELTVTIGGNAAEAGITTGTYTFAYCGSGSTKTTVSKTSNFADQLDVATIIIDEVIPYTIKAGDITLTAPTGFEWASPTTSTGVAVSFSGGLAGQPASAVGTIHWDTYGTGGQYTDKSAMVIPITSDIVRSTTRGTIMINNLRLVAEDVDAPKGDVYVKVKGAGMTEESVKVGTYVSYDVIMEVEDKDLPVRVSGLYPASVTSDSIKTLKVTFKEGTADAWSSTRRTDFVFPDGVKARSVDIKTKNLTVDFNESLVNVASNAALNTKNFSNGTALLNDDGLTLRRVDKVANKKVEIEMTFYLSIEPGYEGDITVTATADGGAVPTSVSGTIATAISPITAEAGATPVEIGTKGIAVTDITIKETVAGAIKKTGVNIYDPGSTSLRQSEDTLVVAIEDMSIEQNSAKVEVTDGDLTVEKTNYSSAFIANTGNNSNTGLKLTIKRESSSASTIKITGTTVNADRTLPQGEYQLRIGGSICANFSDRSKLEDATFDKSYYVAKEDYVKIITGTGLSGSTIGEKVSVTIGNKTLVVGENEIEMDTAPFIEGGYTYIPLSFVAVACGLAPEDVIYNTIEKSVMIVTANRTCKLTKDSRTLMINGISNTIESPALIRDNRFFVPFRVLGEQILGVAVSWDEPTRTATFN